MTMFRNAKSRHEKLEMFFQIIFFIKYLTRTSENTRIRAYVSDTQKKQFFFIFQIIINLSKQRTLPNISLENA